MIGLPFSSTPVTRLTQPTISRRNLLAWRWLADRKIWLRGCAPASTPCAILASASRAKYHVAPICRLLRILRVRSSR
jgi:hypothetical protein